jgi:acyl-coenzyme A thioesterase PaaI-like protein
MTQEPDDSPRHYCFGCGDRNLESLGITFETHGRRVEGRFTARPEHQGWPGLAHGGIAAAVLDEALGWAMYAAGAWAMTARMEVRYRNPVMLGEELIVTAEVTRERGRLLEGFAELRTASGKRLADAKGLFARVDRERAGELEAFFLPDRQAGQPAGQ